jgi:sugar O-acyltransferase (sialic acid O-acetyltransferase NeuD family)
MSTKRKVIVLGSYTFAEELADQMADAGDIEVVAFGENWDRERCKQTVEGRPVIWIDDLAPYARDHFAVCSINSTHRDAYIRSAEALGFRFISFCHPTAHVSRTVSVGDGSLIGPGCIIGSHTRIGRHVILNRGTLIGHHTTIGDFVTVSPGCNIAGNVVIGDRTYIGMGAVILNSLTIGSRVVVGAGAVVTKDVPDGVQVLGVPARITKEGIDGR